MRDRGVKEWGESKNFKVRQGGRGKGGREGQGRKVECKREGVKRRC